MMVFSLCKFLLGFFLHATIPCLCVWTLVENNMSYAVRNDVSESDLHCTPDGAGTGRRKERWKEGSKNGNPPIYVMRIIAASVSCSGGKVREGGRSRDWKIIRVSASSSSMSWRPFQEKREFHRTCYRLQSVTQSEMQYAPISGSSESNANALGLSLPGPAGNSRIFDAARALVSQLPILMNCRQFKGIPQRKEGSREARLPISPSTNPAFPAMMRWQSHLDSPPSPPLPPPQMFANRCTRRIPQG